MIDPRLLEYPPPVIPQDDLFGIYPTDFIIEDILDEGLKWFRETAGAEHEVFGRLMMPAIKSRYGEKKIAEIANYIRSYEIRVIQAFPQDDSQMPTISVNLGEAVESPTLDALDHHAGNKDVLGSAGEIVSREEIGYIPMQDSILIGIHASGTPDKVKYLYHLVTYVLASAHHQLEQMGFHSMQLRATDMNRFNEFLPGNIFTRFLTYQLTSMPRFRKGAVPMVDSFTLNVET